MSKASAPHDLRTPDDYDRFQQGVARAWQRAPRAMQQLLEASGGGIAIEAGEPDGEFFAQRRGADLVLYRLPCERHANTLPEFHGRDFYEAVDAVLEHVVRCELDVDWAHAGLVDDDEEMA